MAISESISTRINIRRARHGDEPSIAQVHIESWQQAYQGIVPQKYLDELPLSFDERVESWQRILNNENRWAFVAERENQILGFVLFGSPRDEGREDWIELGAIYLLASEQKKGTGFSLLREGFSLMKSLGYQRAYCWALDENPTGKFYVGAGAAKSDLTKFDDIGGQRFKEVAYEWQDLDLVHPDWNTKFDKYVGHYSKYQDAFKTSEIPKDFIRVIDSDIGRKVDFNRVAVHHIVLPPGCRTSMPHAESLEEEFIFVLKGNPHLWLNGFIHDLQAGHAVGFQSGTGIAHTFINNTDSEIHLLVAGDRNKKENLCSFPINPELKAECKIWWDAPPTFELGPHNGLPGMIRPNERAPQTDACIAFCPEIPKREPFNYPGDSETFGNGFRITDKVGLKSLGVWYECLPAGKRSAFPHAHTHEEEFIFVLKGQPTVWIDGFAKQIQPGHFAAFPSNTGFNHALINETDEEVVYICIGETAEFVGEKISYPLHPLRREECERKLWYWTEAPKNNFGVHPGVSSRNPDEHLFLKLTDAPSVFTIHKNQDLIGDLELKVNFPKAGVCTIEKLVLKDQFCDAELLKRVRALVDDYIKRAIGYEQIRDWSRFKLVRPNMADKDSFLKGLNAITDKVERQSWIYMSGFLETITDRDFANYIKEILKRETDPPAGFVPDTTYWVERDEAIVGRISLRHFLNDHLKSVGGHIGYIVHPEWRNQGIGGWMLGQLLKTQVARSISSLLLTCDENNIASQKTILSHGGVFDF
jgi:uncharacterized cupin superfamily protein/predicted acetyltransferase/predicted N-acetyltransferase YhbS